VAADDRTRTVIAPSDADRTAPRGPLLDQQATFAAGQLVAERYRIERFIAFGGMGEVYEAEDTALKSRVALKTLRHDVAGDERVLERFKREILLARKVTHTNVCRLFDLGMHHGPDGRTVTFLTMELLDGDTLAHRLRQKGRLPLAEALPILRQTVAALDAAHREGIIHRDFKSGNVMLVGERAVVTDFGLARGPAGDPFSTAVTADKLAMMGSPAYMAPEQVGGEETTVASDVYALGVVMFEMVTGRVPFDGDSAMSVAVRRLKEEPPSPREFNPDVDERWERTILRCLERMPDRRFPDVETVLSALEGTPRRRIPWVPIVLGAAALVVAGLGVWYFRGQDRPARAVREARPAMAVLGFRNVADREDVAWMATALQEMMTTELAAGGELRSIPGESVARMKRDLKLPDADSYAPDTLERIQHHVGADYVLVGAYLPLGNKIRVDLRLQSAAGETLAHVADEAEPKDLAALVARLGGKVRERLRVGEAPEAARQYAEGVARLRLFDMRAARERLEKAIALEPGFPQAYAALGESLAYLGYEARAEEVFKRAFELSGNLPREQRLQIEASYYTVGGSSQQAARAYAELFAAEPDNPEYGIRLASAQLSMGSYDQGMETLARVKQLPRGSDDPRLPLVLVQAAMTRQDWKDARAKAEEVAKAGAARGAQSLVGEAREAEALALWFEGDLAGARAKAEEARLISFTVGDRDGVSASLTTLGFIRDEGGEHEAAKQDAEEALRVAAEVGSRRRIPTARHVLARAALGRGDLPEARNQFEQSAQAAQEMGGRSWEALGRLGVAVVLALEGELDKAEPIYEKLLMGFRLFAPKQGTGYVLHHLGELRMAKGDLAEARKALAEALALREETGETIQVERTRLALARLDLDEGHAVEAETAASTVQQAAVARGLRDDVVFAGAVMVRARLAQGNVEGARRALEEATKASGATDSVWVRLTTTRARGYVLLGQGKVAEAERELGEGAKEAAAARFAELALEMRLGAADAALRGGRRTLARGQLTAIAADAQRMGYRLLASRAEELLR